MIAQIEPFVVEPECHEPPPCRRPRPPSPTTPPGALVFGDADGVVIVPRVAEDEVLERAWAKVDGENTTRDALRAGTSLTEVFRIHGFL